jgi:type II secretion system protein L
MMTSKQWLWFPSENMSWQAVNLPKGRAWREALPFAVEEKLAESVENLHLVPTDVDSDGLRWVAVINESFWQKWQADKKDHAISPDILALPWSLDTGITALIEGNRVRLRWGEWQGAAGDMTQMSALLTLLQAQSNRLITVYAAEKPAMWQQWSLNWQPLTDFIAEKPQFDLREGRGKQWFNWNKLIAYRLPLTLLLMLIGVWFMQTTLSAWQAQQQTHWIKQQTEAQFSAAFPDIKRRVNPLVQAKSELNRRQAASKEQAASLLSALLVAQNAIKGTVSVNQLSWQQGKLSLFWSEDVADAVRARIQVVAPWQLRWISNRQCDIFQGVAP